jgi:U3 small nucleolar ribonucleoprotein protein IMP3
VRESLAARLQCSATFLLPVQVMRRYHIQNRDDYKKYNKIAGLITKLTNVLRQLDGQDTTRIELTDQLLDK